MEQLDLTSTESLKAFYDRVLEHYGRDAQSDAIIEEAAELIHAICKYRQQARKSAEAFGAREQVREEIVDMQIALDQARLIFFGGTPEADKRYAEIRKKKLARLAEYTGIPLE